MASYDFKGAKALIEKHRDKIQSATMGMREDWFWTAEEVYSDGKFKVDLSDGNLTIGGISGSSWATPVIDITFTDGSNRAIECYIGSEPERTPPEWFSLGCLSGPCQESVNSEFVEVKGDL